MTASGEFVTARFGSRFMFSLMNDKVTLKAGKYILMVDPVWNETTPNSHSYKDVIVDIYAPEGVDLAQVEDQVGMQVFARALKWAAMNKVPQDARQTYLEENEDYGTDVIRVSDVESLDCWYGLIYTQNNSPYRLKETVRPDLQGLEICYPALSPGGEEVELDVPAGHDHVIILRRNANSCSYGL